jgi:predicted DNA-binding transcriptional regulator YafY
MSVQGTIKRYSEIVNFVKHRRKPSLADIIEMLQSKGFKIAPRTLQRDFEAVRIEFGIELIYDKHANGYFIDYEKSENIEYILRFWELSNSAQVIIETLREGKDALKYISFDSSENLSGVHLLGQLMTAIKSHQVVSFDYFNFQTERTSNNIVRPYLLKEYQNRWFLYGENEKYGDFRIYGIERLSNLVLTQTVFEPKKDYESAKDFENIIGITLRPFIEDQPEQDIVLSMTREQGRYFKTLPWHPNFTIQIDNETEFQVSLHILPNYEFLQQLLRYCDKITVLKPQWLRDHLKKILLASSEKY